ncbi:MAG TPA: TonB family protein [Acidobacteriaceae bacterium]|nr:TonB family protein [Acidobacteriaceae bacterium]
MAWSYTNGDLLDQAGYERTPLGAPFAKSTLLHLLIAGMFFGYAYVNNFFHGSEWGSNSTQEGAIQATLVSSAAVPLPQDHPPTENVLSTETPSASPALQEQKAEPMPLPEAVPIPEKQTPVKKAQKPQVTPPPPQKQPPPKPNHKANFGEAAPANLPRAAANAPTASAANAVTGGDFGSRFGWYVDVIKRKVAQNWLLPEVAAGTPAGATVYVQFSVGRDGSVSGVRIATPSGSPSLDSSCLHAVQRVDTFGALPPGYNESSLSVLYHCTYPGHP